MTTMTMVLFDKDSNRRRISEECRKTRIFNAKQRQIGLDVETLNRQVHENCLARRKEIDRERQYAENGWRYDEWAVHMEHQQRNAMQEECKRMDEFRLSAQRPENGRDFDLYDPDRKKKEQPARISDQEECPVSGIQRLDGEDLNRTERLRKQKDQVQDLLLQQIQEKRTQDRKQCAGKTDWENRIIQQDKFGLHLSYAEFTNRKEVSTMLSDFNKNLAFQQRETYIRQKMSEEAENRKDIEYNFYGDTLTENPSVARCSSERILPDRWKGMDKAQLEEFYKGQRQQIKENQRKKEQEQYEKTTWNQYVLSQQGTARYLDERAKLRQQQFSKLLQAENQQLAQKQRQRNAYLNKIVYSNVPSKEFFDQFNTNSR